MTLLTSSDDWALRLKEAAGRPHPNESDLRHALYLVFHDYCLSEVGLNEVDIRHEGTSSSGRFDSMFGTALIEYKSPGELDTKKKRRIHAEQALRYLKDQKLGATVVILTDGRTWGILRDPEAESDHVEQMSLAFEQEIQVPAEEQFQWRPNEQESAKRVLELLDTIRFEKVAPRALSARFGPTTLLGKSLLGSLISALGNREANSRADILFNQWVALAGVSYGIESGQAPWPKPRGELLGEIESTFEGGTYGETVFVLHTYIALCSKLMAIEMLALTRGQRELRPSQWGSLSLAEFVRRVTALENGAASRELGAPNLVGGDLFGWYADYLAGDKKLAAATRTLINSFSELAWAKMAHADQATGDLLREFYVSVVPRVLRKALGEFFTPQWIAERVLLEALDVANNSTKPANPRFLDPSCGSGAFLVAAMAYTIARGRAAGIDPSTIARRAVDKVVGFDINPVSALMARVNLLLTLGSLVEQLPEVTLNVFQADSILIPEQPTGQTTFDQVDSAVTVPLVIGNIELPKPLANLRAISVLARYLDKYVQEDRPPERFRQRIGKEFRSLGVHGADLDVSLDATVSIFERLALLHREGRDGVWAHVIEQAFAPRVVSGIDIVIGNPPWISWKNLPNAWRLRSESTWRQWGLWQTAARGKGTPMGDISSLLLARSIATYASDGVVALLLPEGVLVNDPGGRAIRSCFLRDETAEGIPFDPVRVDDFTSLNPFPDAATKPIALYVIPGRKAEFPIAYTKWTRAKARVSLPPDHSWRKVRPSLYGRSGALQPTTSGDRASRWREASDGPAIAPSAKNLATQNYTWGQGFHTRGADGIFYCEIVSETPFSGGLVRIRTRPDLGRNTKGLENRELVIEPDLLWPLARGKDVQRFSTANSGLYCIVPHDPNDPRRILTVSELMEMSPRLFDYLESHEAFLLKRSAYNLRLTKDSPWGIQGTSWRHLRRSSHIVVGRYMSPNKRPQVSVLSPVPDPLLGLTTTKYPNNKVNFVSCASQTAADYLCAAANSRLSQDYISRVASSTTIGPSIMNDLGIPLFDPSVELHIRLANLGQEARLEPDNSDEVLEEIDKNIPLLFGL